MVTGRFLAMMECSFGQQGDQIKKTEQTKTQIKKDTDHRCPDTNETIGVPTHTTQKDTPFISMKQGTAIGTTKDPIAGIAVDGTKGNHEGKVQIKDNKAYYQTNDGSPDDLAVQSFNTLMAPLKWNHIGSSICLGVDSELRFEFLHQVYPTYYLYERQEDGSFVIRKVETQAPNPKDNFNNNPYDPPALGDAPFIIK